MRKLLLVLAAATLAGFGGTPGQRASHNPLHEITTGKPLSCPDPSVVSAEREGYRYFVVCTSDHARNAIPIRGSDDLVHWHDIGFVFPAHHQPWWATASTGRQSDGRYWAPEIFRIGGRWVVYFAALVSPATGLGAGTMVIGVATSTALVGQPWHTRILHYRRQFAAARETPGGAIDPSVLRDPSTGQLYLFWVDQSTEVWVGRLSDDGLRLDPRIHRVLTKTESWECDPRNHFCAVEAPEPFFHDGRVYLLYSGGSTWDESYAVSAAVAPDPMGRFVKLGRPILRTGRGFLGPGHCSQPIIGPDGVTYLLYHALRRPSHRSEDRVVMLDRVNWAGGWPLVNDGRPG
jgi:beta-xylosidase